MTGNPVREVVVAAAQDVQLLDVAGPLDVFDAAAKIAGTEPYRVRVASLRGCDVRSGNGLVLRADAVLEDVVGPIDLLLVPGRLSHGDADDDAVALVGEVARLGSGSRRLASVCTGAGVLAAARLLDGRRATTHWAFVRPFRRAHPRVCWEPDRLVVRDGPVVTSAGVSAGLDLALSLVSEDLGVEVAREVARWLVVFLRRPGGQAQFRGRLVVPALHDGAVLAIVDRIVASPRADHRIETLAAQASLSARQLTRRFAQEVGTTPARFVDSVRVEAAREALEDGSTVEAAARRSGFRSAEVMRRTFLRSLGIGPADYQDRFRTPYADTMTDRRDPLEVGA